MTESDDSGRTVRLPERHRLTATNEQTHAAEASVHCPVTQASQSVVSCRTCARYLREVTVGAHAFLECRVPEAGAVPPEKTLCGELLSPEVTCLDCELDAARAVEVLAIAGVTSAPVLDDNSVLIGVVSTSSLARLQQEARVLEGFGGHDALEVEDAMTTEVVTLPQRATLGEAARLMASRGLDRLPIVTDDGHLVGVLSAMDLVRWLAGWAP